MRGNEGDAELMRDRLKKLILETDILCTTCGENADSYCAEYLADCLIANGGILLLCKVGDTVYVINRSLNRVFECTVMKQRKRRQ